MTQLPVAAGELVGLDYLNEVSRAHWTKSTAKLVSSSVAETDLLNGELTIDAGAMGSTRLVRVTMLGDNLGNNGAQNSPRFKVKFGGTTYLDTNVLGASWAASATRYSWRAVIEIENLAATNVQRISLDLKYTCLGIAAATGSTFTTGTGGFSQPAGSAVPACAHALGNAAGAQDTTTSKLVEFSVTLPSTTSTEWQLFSAKAEVV